MKLETLKSEHDEDMSELEKQILELEKDKMLTDSIIEELKARINLTLTLTLTLTLIRGT